MRREAVVSTLGEAPANYVHTRKDCGYVCVMPTPSPDSLRSYALIADGERGALIGPAGDVAFMCAPRWHDGTVFGSLVGAGGHYLVTPQDRRHVWGGHYEPDTLIWRSRWVSDDEIIESRDALAAPASAHRAVLLRRIEASRGVARMEVALRLAAEFGEQAMDVRRVDERTWIGSSGSLHLRWSVSTAIEWRSDEAGGLSGFVDVPPGEHCDLVLELSDQRLPTDPVRSTPAWAATEAAWRAAIPSFDSSIASADCRHSYAVLRGLTSSDGGMVAAATLGLPERAGVGRNYDYRYAWIRDQCYTGQAIAAAGPHGLVDDAVRFVSSRLLADGSDLTPAYTVGGGRVPDEQSLPLDGYPGGADKVGNWVNKQFQLDAFGEALLLFAAAARHDRLDSDHHQAALTAIAAIEQRWTEPDAGIWELGNDRWTHSRLACAAGLRTFAAATRDTGADRWRALADRLVDDAGKDGVHPSGRWQRAPDDTRVDASLLLPALRGAVPASDPRSVATLEAVRHDLGRDGYVYRFRHDDRPLNEAEGAFLLCGFHLALAEHQAGDEVTAMRRFERHRASCGPPGLFTEEYDVVQRQLRGNVPQAFVHALLIETATRLAGPSTPGSIDSSTKETSP